jgi:hypothetical protein
MDHLVSFLVDYTRPGIGSGIEPSTGLGVLISYSRHILYCTRPGIGSGTGLGVLYSCHILYCTRPGIGLGT